MSEHVRKPGPAENFVPDDLAEEWREGSYTSQGYPSNIPFGPEAYGRLCWVWNQIRRLDNRRFFPATELGLWNHWVICANLIWMEALLKACKNWSSMRNCQTWRLVRELQVTACLEQVLPAALASYRLFTRTRSTLTYRDWMKRLGTGVPPRIPRGG